MFRTWAILGLPAILLVAAPLAAQQPKAVHYRYPSQTPLGQVGAERLRQGGPVVGYYQPVAFSSQSPITISLANDGTWTDGTVGKVHAALQLGQPYRLKLTNLPLHTGRECYPTIEVVDRTYPPGGMEFRFPIPVVFNDDDIRLAMDGMFVTRVIYVEDPQLAIPGGQQPGEQLWHDAGAAANPLEIADQLGRPVAIIRMGGRLPDERHGPDYAFQFGCPKWFQFTPPRVEAVPVPMKPAQTTMLPNKGTK
jgi:hypothetical protein